MNRIRLIEISLSIAMIFGIIMSINLWNSHRIIPYCSNLSLLKNNGKLISDVGTNLLLIVLSLNLFFRQKIVKLLIIALTITLFSVDLNRLQPWVYIYLILFLLCFIKEENTFSILSTVLFVSIYVWSGLHKINTNFLNETYFPLIKSFGLSSDNLISKQSWIGYFIPITEIILGIGLVFIKTRKNAVYSIALFHLIIIFYEFFFKDNKNSIIVPWNLEMIILSFLIFFKNNLSISHIYQFKKFDKLVLAFVIAVVSVFPFFNFFNLWDDYMSFSLYSAKNKLFYIAVSDRYLNKLDVSFNGCFLELDKNISGGKVIDMNAYFLKNFNVPVYPEKRIFEELKIYF